MKKSVYLETSVVSYFIGKPSRDIIIADSFGCSLPVICTPEELMGDNYL